MSKRSAVSLASSLLLAVLVSGCGSDDDGKSVDEPVSDAGSDAAADFPTLNGCTAADYRDLSSASEQRVVAIAASGLNFTPKCMIVAAGQKVRWEGSLTAHPLSPGSPADLASGTTDNPIMATSTGNSVEFTFPAAGTFPYHCTLHAFGNGQGMAGSIHVR